MTQSASIQNLRAVYWEHSAADDRTVWSETLHSLLAGTQMRLDAPRQQWHERIHADDRHKALESYDALMRGESSRITVSYRVRTDAGAYINVTDRAFCVFERDVVTRVIGVVNPAQEVGAPPAMPLSATRDMTAKQLETFVDSLPLLSWEADADGWIYFYNRGWYEYTGTTPQQMEGWGWIAVHDQTDLPRILKVWRNALQTGQPWEDEFRLRRYDGSFRWFLSRATPLYDDNKRLIRWFGSNVDIHEQRLALQERERLLRVEQRQRAAAERANQEKDEFLAVVSHELRSPLTAIVGWAAILDRVSDQGEKVKDAAGKIQRNTKALARLIEDLLDMSRIVAGKLQIEREAVELKRTIERAIETAQSTADAKKIELRFQATDPHAQVSGSEVRIQQILSNLIGNAIKFSRAGKPIEITLDSRDGQAVIAVRDFGEGISSSSLPHIFERFHQADGTSRRQHGGLGLGLSIVRSLVQLHGGSVEASSLGLGQGSEFTVRLPLQSSRVLPPQIAAAEDRPPASLSGINVLCVDDDADILDMLTNTLLHCGSTVTAVGSVAECLVALRTGTPDLIISDLMMPEVDGFGLIERIRSNANPAIARLPVIALTARADVQNQARALAAGFDTYLSKPFEPVTLSYLIKELSGRR